MTQTEKNMAAKKADTALCKAQDLFYGYNITDSVANKLNAACDALRAVVDAIESVEPKPNKKS